MSIIWTASRLSGAGRMLSGEEAYRLYDTFGFPIDLTREILAEKAVSIDEKGFEELMKASRLRNREIAKSRDLGWEDGNAELFRGLNTHFHGYDTLSESTSVLRMISGAEEISEASEGDEITVMLGNTPFYAESGGQVGDSGYLKNDLALVKVKDCRKLPNGQIVHMCLVERGYLASGDNVTAQVDVQRRHAYYAQPYCRPSSSGSFAQSFGRSCASGWPVGGRVSGSFRLFPFFCAYRRRTC